jgi:hypothetical protein
MLFEPRDEHSEQPVVARQFRSTAQVRVSWMSAGSRLAGVEPTRMPRLRSAASRLAITDSVCVLENGIVP